MDKILSDLKKSFIEVDDLLNLMFFTFSLKNINECRLMEDEISTLEDDYESYKKEFKNLTRGLISFSKNINKKPLSDDGFSKYLSKKIKETKEFYNDICIKNKNNDVLMKKVNDSYFCYMLMMRALNTCIKEYNLEFPNFKINELDLDEPKYINFDVNLSDYIEDYVNKINDILKD